MVVNIMFSYTEPSCILLFQAGLEGVGGWGGGEGCKQAKWFQLIEY